MNAYSFSNTIENEIDLLDDSEYRLKTKARTKWLIEEALPIAKLAVSRKRPGLAINVQAYEDDAEEDGLISETALKHARFEDKTYKVQVTQCYNYEDALRDEELALTGSTCGAGSIGRDKKTGNVVSEGAAVDFDAYVDTLSKKISSAFNKKKEKHYASAMVLIISFEDVKVAGLTQWSLLLSQLERYTDFASSDFLSIYLFNSASNEIQRITLKPKTLKNSV